MGSLFSSTMASAENEKRSSQTIETLPTQEPQHLPYYGRYVPAEASMTREDSLDWYASFFGTAECAPHRDGRHIIVRFPHKLPGQFQVKHPRAMEGWPVVKLQKVYERLAEHHARIVQYYGALDDGSLLIERLWPGPFNFDLPVMTVPFPAQPSREDKMMLSLYYRWALHGLSALSALHAQKIYLRTFNQDMIWLRSDYSLALTGFVGADITGDETEYGEAGGSVFGEDMVFDEDAWDGCVEEDIYYWATFVWRLMTNDYTDESPSIKTSYCWEPCCPVEGGCVPYSNGDLTTWNQDRYVGRMWQELEDARLGRVLVNAWSRKYRSAEEVAEYVKATASILNIVIIDDEVKVDENWEDVFEVVETGPLPHARMLKFRQKAAKAF